MLICLTTHTTLHSRPLFLFALSNGPWILVQRPAVNLTWCNGDFTAIIKCHSEWPDISWSCQQHGLWTSRQATGMNSQIKPWS